MYRVIVLLLLSSIVLISGVTAQMSTASTVETIDSKEPGWAVNQKDAVFDKAKKPISNLHNKPDLDLILQGGDVIEQATVIGALPYYDYGTTAGYTDNYDEVCPFEGSYSPDVVYSYTPTFDEVIGISLCNPGTDYDTKLYVYEDSWIPGSPYACNDDACPGYVSEIIDLPINAGHTYYIVIDGYEGDFGNYELTIMINETVECIVECPLNSVPEGEGCGYDTNGGCNMPEPAFGSIACRDTVCGSGWADGGTRDTDWYMLDITSAQEITITACAEFPFVLGVIEQTGPGDCDTTGYIDPYALGDPCDTITIAATVPAGEGWPVIIFMAPQDFYDHPCVLGDTTYWMTANCTSIQTEYTYIRGDVDNDGDIDSSDVFYLVDYFNAGGPPPPYEVDGFYPSADVNGDCWVSASDITHLVQYVEMLGIPLLNCPDYPPWHYGEVVIGNIDGSPMEVYIGEIVDIPVWVKTNRPMRHLHIPISTDNQHVSARLGGTVFSPLNGWDYADFEPPDEDQPETGFTSQSLLATTDLSADPGSFLNTNGGYWKIAEFTIQISTNPSIVGDIIQFSEGYHPGMEGVIFGDDTGHYHRAFAFIESDVIILSGVSLDYISGIGNVTYMGEGISVRPSLTILSTIYTVGDMFFIEITDEYDYVVYTNTIYSRPIAEGTNVIEFDTDWVITSPGTYEAFAEFTSAGDYPGDNSGYKLIIITDFVYEGLPPREGFDEGLLASLPDGFSILNEDEEDPAIWAIVSGDKWRSPSGSVAVLGGGTANQSDWLIQGPVDLLDSGYLAPAVYFWEAHRYWGEYAAEMHEFYASIGNFNIEDTKGEDPILRPLLTHTRENHYIPGFTDDSVLIELPPECSSVNGIYFAWRYVSNGDNPAERHQWFIDDITWADMGYIAGDVNADGNLIGSDVTYLVAYFVSGGPAPIPVEAGDVNGDCSLIGSDVTYLVAYFVGGGPAPVRGDCP